jgi:hypothetical protein
MKHVAPKDGMRLRIPEENYRVLPPEGADVRWNMFWAKAEQRGEIDVTDVAKEEGKAAKAGQEHKAGKNPEVSAVS